VTALALVGGSRSLRVVERNVRSYLRMWPAFVSGFVEPVFYLLSIGIGVGELIGDVEGPSGPIPYRAFVAPALIATSATIGCIFDTTINFFVRYKYVGVYRAVVATPLRPRDIAVGEVAWSLVRGGVYAAVFLLAMLAMGLVESGWAVLAVPVAMLAGFGFAGVGLAASTWMRTWLDFEFVSLAIIPLFLFSGVFFPIEQYPAAVERLVEVSPLYQAVVLERGLVLGDVHPGLLLRAAYLLVMGWVGLRVASRRLTGLLHP